MRTLSFDPQLPRLPVLDDTAAVAALLAPGTDVARVRRQDTKYVPGTSCVAAFELSRARSDTVTLGAIVVSPEDVVAYDVHHDPALPQLRLALDEPTMRARFSGTRDTRDTVHACRVRPVRYKPGARCVLRYDVTASSGSETFYAKVLSGGVAREAAVAQRLGEVLSRHPHAATVPPVTASWPDLGMLVQPALRDSVELHDLVTDAGLASQQRRSIVEGAGRALAALHVTAPPEVRQRTLHHDLVELRDYLGAVELADPACARLIRAMLDRLAAADDGAAEEPVTTHGAFRTDQLLVAGDRLVLIDLDTVCRAEPARDIGNLLAYLDWKAIRRPDLAAIVAEIGAGFLAGYGDVRPLPAQTRLVLYRAASLAKIAGRRFRSLTTNEWPLVPELLAAGTRALSASEVFA